MQLHEQTNARREKGRAAIRDLAAQGFVVTTENRGTAKRLLNGLGWPSSIYESASLDILNAVITKPHMHQSQLIAAKLNSNDQRKSLFRLSNFLKIVEEAKLAECFQELASRYPETPEGPTAPIIGKTAEIVFIDDVLEPAKLDANEAADMLAKALAAISGLGGGALDEHRVIELVKQHAPKPQTFNVQIDTPESSRKLPDGLRHKDFPTILQAVGAGLHVMMVGPAGSGKTTLASQVADALELPFSFNGAIASEYKLNGFIDAQGRYVSTAFRKAFEGGGVYLFDEIDASMPQALLAFNAALANGCADFPDGNITMHKDFRCLAAANTFGRGADRVYVGRNQLDGASLDRFAVIDLDYDEKLERALAGNDTWTDRVQQIRKGVQKAKVRHVVSPRASMNGAKLLAIGMKQKLVESVVVWKGLDQETKNRVQNAMEG
ncbi:MAG: AAA family ATPase [Rhodobacteraceae bacterium]|nr:AAA family ATPase [Paracoccaceae bacterium]